MNGVVISFMVFCGISFIAIYCGYPFYTLTSPSKTCINYIRKDQDGYYFVVRRSLLLPLVSTEYHELATTEYYGRSCKTKYIEDAVKKRDKLNKSDGYTWFKRYLEVRKELEDIYLAKLEAIKQEQLNKLINKEIPNGTDN